MSGIRRFSTIDAKACYWTIAYNSGIISKKTFDKYIDKKELRLVSIGNLNKTVRKTKVIKGEKDLNGSTVIENDHAWVSKYILSEAFSIYEKVQEATDNSVFKFKTDCVFLSEDYVAIAKKTISDLNFKYTVKTFEVAGMDKGAVVAYNTQTGDEYKTHLGGYRKLRGILREIKSN